MSFEQAERRLHELQKMRDSGRLDDAAFRVEAAKLLLRDEQGAFWLPDPDSGDWFRNQGSGWEPGDPHAAPPPQPVEPQAPRVRRRRTRLGLVLFIIVLGLLVAAAGWLWREGPLPALSRLAEPELVQVTIASPADGSQAAIGQVVAIESTLLAQSGLQAVDRVEFQVNGESIGSLPLSPQLEPGQTSLPLSQQWRPAAVGEQRVTVTAYSTQGEPLASAAITLEVVQASDEILPEPDCIPDASFVADVTIPPDSAFAPGARLDKVWQVRNSGSCAWGVGYELVLVEGDSLGAPNAVPVPPTAAGNLADLALTFWAPDPVGVYANLWRLQAPDGQFFGPDLLLSVVVEPLAQAGAPPVAPANLQAAVMASGSAVRLTWTDRSDNEDAFRVHREDVEASIGLAPAGTGQFVDEDVICGHTYRYRVVAFNAAGASSLSPVAEVSLPACAPPDAPPTLILTVVPTQVVTGAEFTIVFQAEDDVGVTQVTIQGQATGDQTLDEGQVFPCSGVICAGSWPMIWSATEPATSTVTTTLEIVAVALDSSGQESAPARAKVTIRPAE